MLLALYRNILQHYMLVFFILLIWRVDKINKLSDDVCGACCKEF